MDKIIEELRELRASFETWQEKVLEEEANLAITVVRFLGNDGIHDAYRLSEAIELLPPASRVYDQLVTCLFRLENGVPAMDINQAGGLLARAMPYAGLDGPCNGTREEIMAQVNVFQEKDMSLKAVQKELHALVWAYVDREGVRTDLKKLEELIKAVPNDCIRFRLYEIKLALKRARKERMLRHDESRRL